MKENYKYFLKDSIRKTIDFSTTEQNRGVEPPPIQKPCPPGSRTITLVRPGQWKSIKGVPIEEAIAKRQSRRVYTSEGITLDELSFLLWATQGLRNQNVKNDNFRTVPSAGCRHALETYIAAFRVGGISKAIYRYLPVRHELVEFVKHDALEELISRAAFDQSFAGKSAATFIWTTIPARMEWRYSLASYKVIAIDAGHVCQNLYLACEAIGAGTCAIAAYDQELADSILGVDGVEEFTIYMAPVGKIR